MPVARRLITIARASSSSGEKGTVRMSSTPRSNARSFVLRSPRRVSPRTGVPLRLSVFEAPSSSSSAVLSSWSMSITARFGTQSSRIACASARVRRGPHGEHAVVEGERDEVDDQRAVVEHERAARFDDWRNSLGPQSRLILAAGRRSLRVSMPLRLAHRRARCSSAHGAPPLTARHCARASDGHRSRT